MNIFSFKTKKTSIISFTKAGYLLSLRMRDALWAGMADPDESAAADTVAGDESLAVVLYTTNGAVAEEHPEVIRVTGGLKKWCQTAFFSSDLLIFVGASGIAVRTIAPYLVSKTQDPAVLVADEKGLHVISLLSGHLGGGNDFTRHLAGAIDADPVITTASDVSGKLAVDAWAKQNRLTIASMNQAKLVAADIVEGKQLPFFCDGHIQGSIPEELIRIDDLTGMLAREQKVEYCGQVSDRLIYISARTPSYYPQMNKPGALSGILHLIPRAVILGIGCKRGKTYEQISDFVLRTLEELHVAKESVVAVTSIDLKADEAGLQQLAMSLRCPFLTFSANDLMATSGEFSSSEFVKQTTGADNVCERSAMTAIPAGERQEAHFICTKKTGDGVTMAILEKKWSVTFPEPKTGE